MIKRPKSKQRHEAVRVESMTLATILAALERPGILSATRLRDLRSAVKRVADLLGNEPAGIALDMEAISTRLGTISLPAVGISAKRFANIRSDFVAAVKASGVRPVAAKKSLSPEWVELLARLSGRRAQIGLSRLARYASAHDIKPGEVNDDVIDGFITAVREGSLHRQPKTLHRQVALIWNEAAREPLLGLHPVAVPSFRGPPQRIEWSLLPAAFRRDVDKYLCWGSGSDPFAPEARSRPLAADTLRLRRDQIHAAVSALVNGCQNPRKDGGMIGADAAAGRA